ncbi:MAG: hypothetical protein JXQ71_17130 [Verrucomicrobia bacterium]|nr:hypothetical protein [Verrucomicrobiota bacterium]
MKRRDKLLLFAIAGLAAVFVLGYTLKTALAKPLKAADQRNAALRSKLAKLNEERRAYFAAEDLVKQHARRCFADTVDEASARSGEMITKLILESGLREADFTRLPHGPRAIVPKGDQEIGWIIQGQGPLANVVNLLFLLQHSPQLHRIDTPAITPGDKPGFANVRLKYLTLVVSPAPDVQPQPLPPASLDSPQHKSYHPILARDIFRPYVKRPPPPPEPARAPPPAQVVSAPAEPGPETFRIVSLSEWNGRPEIHVMNLNAKRTATYKAGDTLADGVVVMVDYRALPMPGKPGLMSFSRVILKIGSEFWAIERGQTLAEKYKLTPNQVPPNVPQLQAASSPAP